MRYLHQGVTSINRLSLINALGDRQSVEAKPCTKCGETKPLDEFYKSKASKDGLQSYCKACNSAASRQWNADNPDRRAAYNKRWYADNPERSAANTKQWKQDHPEEAAAFLAKWNADNPLKRKAQSAVRTAIRSGKLTKPTNCTECGIEAKLDGHHPDYSKPFEVMWLCRKCHMAWHMAHGTGLNGKTKKDAMTDE